jgi:hypothetical protein
MSKEQKDTGGVFYHLLGIVPIVIRIFSNLSQFITITAKHLAKNLLLLFIFIFVLLGLLMITWLCTLGLLLFYLLHLKIKLLLSIYIILFLNVFIMGLLSFMIIRIKDRFKLMSQ